MFLVKRGTLMLTDMHRKCPSGVFSGLLVMAYFHLYMERLLFIIVLLGMGKEALC